MSKEPAAQQTQLDELRDQILADSVCAGLAEQATQLVMGAGNPGADIVFIGEAPGKKEDELGVPFVGASGRFLDEMLGAAKLGRDDVYITNIVKYRPPNNRDPSPDEKREFWPYLMRQLEIIAPKVVITLGRHSGQAFIPDLVISRDHGHERKVTYQTGEFLVIPLYHPAAALYNGGMRQTLIDDFLKAAHLALEASETRPSSTSS
jgi:DNA polymerase